MRCIHSFVSCCPHTFTGGPCPLQGLPQWGRQGGLTGSPQPDRQHPTPQCTGGDGRCTEGSGADPPHQGRAVAYTGGVRKASERLTKLRIEQQQWAQVYLTSEPPARPGLPRATERMMCPLHHLRNASGCVPGHCPLSFGGRQPPWGSGGSQV